MMLDTNLCRRHSLSVVELIKAYKMQIRRTLGKVGEDMVREYLNYCLQQDDVFSKWLEIFNKQS